MAKRRRRKVKKFSAILKQIWYFIWEDDSIWSWIVNIILAFVIIKFLVYPGLGLVMGTSHPIVAVVSGSMEHDSNFDNWWGEQNNFYSNLNITKDQFKDFRFRNGFNTGDIMLLTGTESDNIKTGDVIVYISNMPDPIIHRVVKVTKQEDQYFFQTKGDHNTASNTNELNVGEEQIIGKALFKVPLLGWIKIGFVKILKLVSIK